jgi:starch phosphorylase
VLERKIVPEFYTRDASGIPRAWVARIRASMAGLAPRFSSNRMMREYVEQHYLPAASALRRRSGQDGKLARELSAWANTLERHWHELRFGNVRVGSEADGLGFEVSVHLGSIPHDIPARHDRGRDLR